MPLGDVDATLDRLLAVLALVIVGVLLVLGVAAAWLVRLGLRPLDRMGTTAGIIAGGDLSRRVDPATNRTEVGRLGLALNAMLDRLEVAFSEKQASEERLRRFLSDASHELRTPLASIRGYAELFRMGATRTPEEVERAMRRIEEEAARMGLLVEDLLALARLDELRDPVRTPVDVGQIARDAVDDARATAPERPFELDAEPGATVLGDPGELRQVLANLLRNAVVHTPPGTPVAVAVAPLGDDVRIRVRDHGPGLPTEDPDALFDRFWRAEPRARARAGRLRPRARDRRRDRRGAPWPRARRERPRRRRVLHRAAARRGAGAGRCGRLSARAARVPRPRPWTTRATRSASTRTARTMRWSSRCTASSTSPRPTRVQQRLDALAEAGTPTRLDLDDLRFMDSSGLRIVLQAAETSRDDRLGVHDHARLRAGADAVRLGGHHRPAPDRRGALVTSAPITLTLPRDAGAPRRARALLREHAEDLDAARLDTAVLLISELVTNAVLHGGGEIRLLIDVDRDRLARFAVSDEGGGSPVVRDDPGADGGWGLRLVGQLAARWGVLEGRTQVWFEV